jgi:hypothetical protein
MITINKDWFFKNWKIIVIIILVILLFRSCGGNNDNNLATERKQSKEKIESAKEKINSLVEQVVSANKKIKALESNEAKLIANNIQLQKSKSDLSKSVKSKIDKAKTFQKDEIANYFVDKYKLPNDVKTVEFGTQLSDTVAKQTIVDLIGGEGALAELELTQKELYNYQDLLSNKDKILDQYKEKEVNLYSIIGQKDTIIDTQINFTKEVEKSLRKEKRNKRLYQITTVLAVIGGGYLLLK